MSAVNANQITDLFQNHREALLNFLLQRVHCHHTAQDLSQESYLRLIKQESLSHHDNLPGYLFKIAECLSIDFLRQNKRLQTKLQQLDDEIPCPKLDLEQITILQQQCELLLAAIAQMPKRCREIFLLRKIDELSYSEIATRLDISEKTVQRSLVDAMLYCHDYLYLNHD